MIHPFHCVEFLIFLIYVYIIIDRGKRENNFPSISCPTIFFFFNRIAYLVYDSVCKGIFRDSRLCLYQFIDSNSIFVLVTIFFS